MFDRVVEVKRDRPMRIVAEQDILQDAWYFQCHFKGDPVQPGCLGLDAVWQLLGLFLFLNGGVGSGPARTWLGPCPAPTRGHLRQRSGDGRRSLVALLRAHRVVPVRPRSRGGG